jgi:hypothetical protein
VPYDAQYECTLAYANMFLSIDDYEDVLCLYLMTEEKTFCGRN